jgi:hypothetical protein
VAYSLNAVGGGNGSVVSHRIVAEGTNTRNEAKEGQGITGVTTLPRTVGRWFGWP